MKTVGRTLRLWCGFGHSASGVRSLSTYWPKIVAGWSVSETHSYRKRDGSRSAQPPRPILRRASVRPISTKAEVTSGPPTRIRVGVFILFHS